MLLLHSDAHPLLYGGGFFLILDITAVIPTMNPDKQLKKLAKTFVKADECADRKTAQKLIRKADKIRAKLEE